MKRKTFISCIAPSAPETAGRRLKRAAMTLLAALLTATTAGAQDAITGLTYNSTDGYYEISDAQDLVDLANYVNANNNTSGNNASGKTFKQTQDIDMSSAGNFEPIGSQPNNYNPTPFNGTYDGQGYAIIGLTVNTESPIAGLFGYMKGGSVRNLTMVNPNVTSNDNSESSKYAGGIVGAISPGTIENCNVINPTLKISSENGPNIKGAICGGFISSGATVTNCYYYTTTNYYNAVGYNAPGVAYSASCTYTLTLNDGITTSTAPAFSYGGTEYYAGTITLAAAPMGWVYKYSVNGSPIDGNTFDISGNATVSRTAAHISPLLGYDDDPLVDGSAEHPYTIKTTEGWDLFCDLLADNTMGYFSGKTVQLGADITVTRMAGGSNHAFTGTFDGGGHTLTLAYGTADAPVDAQFVAPFVETANDGEHQPTFRNLTIAGSIYSGYATDGDKGTGGLIGHLFGGVTVEHCVSTVTVNAARDRAGGFVGLCEHAVTFTDCVSSAIVTCTGSGSGFVGWSRNGEHTIAFYGCLFDGKVLKQGTVGRGNGSFVGWKGFTKTVTITNCIAAPATDENMATDISATFCRYDADTNQDNGETHITNSYYTQTLGDAQGKALHTVTAGTDVTVAHAGVATHYATSGITAYKATGASADSNPFIAGLLYNNNILYAGSDDQLSLTLTTSAQCDQAGYQYAYTASAGTLSGSTLTMPDQDVTISVNTAALAPIDWATVNQGDSEDPYMIYNKDQLLLLAHRVNGTNGETVNTYEGKYFKLGADITFDHDADEGDDYAENYEAIGGYDGGTERLFKGNFDGDGHTVSGIRIRKTGSSSADIDQGLFGRIASGANIYDVHLTDARITGYYSVGGIAGFNAGTVSGCTVTDSYITAYNGNYGTICGFTNYGDRLTNNYYHGCTVNGTAATSGVGCKEADIAANNGALPAYRLDLADGVTIQTPMAPALGFTCDADNNGTAENYWRTGAVLTLGYTGTAPDGYIVSGYTATNGTVGGNANDGYTLTMPNADVTVTATFSTPDPNDFSQSGDTYTIHSAAGWNVFCDLLAQHTKGYFSGKTVQLGADITVTRMAGGENHAFTGTFDGGGHTLTLDYGTADEPVNEEFVAPFVEVAGGAKFTNLNIGGHIYAAYTGTDDPGVGGLIGHLFGGITIEDCTSTVTVNSTKDRVGGFVGLCEHAVKFTNCKSSASVTCTGSGSGFVGWSRASEYPYTIAFEGCLFDGKLLKKNDVGSGNGGFVGWTGSTKTVSIKNSLVALDGVGSMASSNSATFARGWDGTFDNSYYTQSFGTAQGKQAHTVSAGDNVTIEAIALTGTATQYTVSGITAYSGGGLQRGQTLYYGSDDQLSLTLTTSAQCDQPGYQYGYTASAGTLSGNTLTMPDQDVTISVNTAALAPIDWATVNQGTDTDPYMIYNKDQLLLLAHRVNGTNGETANTYQGMYFKLGADITFDHPVAEPDDYDENYEAIGGRVGSTYRYFKGEFDGANHTVSGIRIRKDGSGSADINQGLFGCIASGANIYDVHLTDARITGYYSVGGIAGYNNEGYISGCSVTDSYITALSLLYGTICGENLGTLTNNYYHGCTVNSTAVTSGMGCYGADITANNGALPAYAITFGDGVSTTALASAPENGFVYNGVSYYREGLALPLASTLASEVPAGYTLFSVNGTAFSGNTYTVNATDRDVTISATFSQDGDTYTIHTAGGWNVFCYLLADNDKGYFSGQTVTLGADITATTTVGTSDHPFTGTFDGNDKTLTVNISETSTQGTAPFRYISGGAVIKNLTVAGSVTGTTHAAGLVGFSEGGTSESPNTIEDCTVSTSVSGGSHNGGVVGHGLTSYLKIKNTVFSGSIANGSSYMGGLQGWSDGNHLTIDNCIFKGSWSGSGSFHPIAIHNPGSTTSATVSGAYYTVAPTLTDAAKIAATGTQVSTSAPSDVVCGPVTAADNQTYYAPVTVSGINKDYFYTGNEIAIDYTVTAADGTSLTKDTHYTETISPATVKDMGDYTLTLTGTGSYSGSQTFHFTVSSDINLPINGTKTLNLTEGIESFKVYDDGGKDGNYSDNCSGSLTINAPTGYVLQLSGSITTEVDCDKLTVYDNNEASGTKLLDGVNNSSNGTQTDITTVSSTGQSMTIYFNSDNSKNYAGLDLTVAVVNVSTDFDITTSTVMGGSITADKSKAKVGETVTLTATPDSGYLLGGISVKGAYNNDVAVTDMRWYTGINTATFAMPGSTVTVTPTFTNTLTVEGGLYINMPKTGTMAAIIPSGVKSFKVYDDGGKDGNYSNYCRGTLTLTVPAGYVLQLSGSITIETDFDNLTVYDNSEASGTKLLDGVSNFSNGTQTDITTVTSTGSVMTLYFNSDGSTKYAGLDLTVTVVKPIELADAADNTEAINGWQNGLANVTLQGRTLYKDGSWNTLCLPFAVDLTATDCPLSGDNVQAMTLNTTTSNLTGSTLTLNFDAATTIDAGTPFIIKWDESGTDITNPVFKDVTIDAEKHDATVSGVLTFTGTYAPVSIADNTKLYLGAANKLYYPSKARIIGCQRAYFQLLGDLTAGEPVSSSNPKQIRAFNLNFGDDEATGIVSAEANSSLFTLHSSLSEWYTLDGRKLDKQPTAKGLYIHGGKKVAIK